MKKLLQESLALKNLSLNELYNQYNSRKITRSKFECYIYYYYFMNQKSTSLGHWQRDDYEDFVSWFYPRLKKAIDKYYDKGFNFETYINKYFLVASREYKVRTITDSITEYSAWSACIPDLYLNEEAPEYNCDSSENKLSSLISKKNKRRDTRRILALIIKCYNYVSDDFIEKAAPLLNIKKEELKEMLNKIRKLRQKNDDALYLLKEKQYCQFYRCIILEKKLLLVKENTAIYSKLENQLKNSRIKLEKIRNKLTLAKKDATNSQVAEVIGVCKGSIDSSLHKLKEKFK